MNLWGRIFLLALIKDNQQPILPTKKVSTIKNPDWRGSLHTLIQLIFQLLIILVFINLPIYPQLLPSYRPLIYLLTSALSLSTFLHCLLRALSLNRDLGLI